MTVTEYIRESLLKQAGLVDPPTLAELRRTEWSTEFETLMRNRLIMGSFRYGKLARTSGEYDTMASIEKRITIFRETGNAETLVDIANLCLVTFARRLHPNFHFNPTDDGTHAEPL